MKKKILFICTHNAIRSQMAEGYMRAKYGNRYEVFSGGVEKGEVHPIAIAVMKEIGIDISRQRSKFIDEFYSTGIDTVVTVCDSAKAACPFFPGAKEEIHQGFSDPAAFTGTDDEIWAGFRRVRDEIIRWIDMTFGNTPAPVDIESSKMESTNVPPDQGLLVELTESIWKKTVEDQTKPVAVMFYSPTCPFCRQIEPYVENYAKEFRETILFGHLNVLTNISIVERYGIRQTPTFKIFCGRKPVLEIVGAIYPAMLKKMLEVVRQHREECTSGSTAIDFEKLAIGK
jgi:arsenate reductase